MKINKVTITTKKKRDYIAIEFDNILVSPDKQMFDEKYIKKSNQLMSRSLSDVLEKLEPHLLYSTELCDTSIILGKDIDAKKFFDNFEFRAEERFQGLKVTGIEFIGNNDVIDSVKLKGYRETQLTDKGFKVKFETPVINLDRAAENHYPLVHLLDEQINDLHTALLAWHQKGETLSVAQQAMFEEA